MNASDKDNPYSVKGRIWIEIHDKAMIGEGKLRLLEKTANLGSLRKAASEMNMSYRKAWYSINQMNEVAFSPLIVLKRGGRHGGVAEITELGKKILDKFKKMEVEFNGFLEVQTKFINS